VAQYKACVTAGPCRLGYVAYERLVSSFPGCNDDSDRSSDHPMNCVDWNGANAFCGWIGARLPTEDEWHAEASARGRYPWGDVAASCGRAVMADGGPGCGRKSTWPVCSKALGNSVSGLCDMSGNVWEWTSTQDGAGRVLRGGGWSGDRQVALSAAGRYTFAPVAWDDNIGFRCARANE
jgi:sulfatase modifying factor 1